MIAVELAVVRSLAWFDLLHCPLTAFECWYYLYPAEPLVQPPAVFEVQLALDGLKARGLVREENGFWQLADSVSWVAERQARVRASIPKLKRAAAGARVLRWLPFVELVAVGNTVAYQVARSESDIDLFIVTSPRRLMLVRLLAISLFQLMGWRQHRSHVTNRLCLNFYVTASALDLSQWKYPSDPYLTYWLAGLVPFGSMSMYHQFIAANPWVGRVLPCWWQSVVGYASTSRTKPWLTRGFEFMLSGGVGNVLESLVAAPQLAHIKAYLKRFSVHEPDVVVSPDVLKLHTNDRRREFTQKWTTRLAQIASTW